jgi:hypothetical protein
MGSGAVPGTGAATGSVMGAGPGADTGTGGGKPDNGADTGTGEGETPGQGADPGTGGDERPGTGAADQDAGRARRGDDGALFPGKEVSGGGLACLAAVVPGGTADRAAGSRRCFPPSNERPSCPAAGSLAPR